MKKLLILTFVIASSLLGACQPSSKNHMEYKHMEISYQDYYYNFNPDNMVELVFAKDGLVCHYDSFDQFDYDNLSELTGRKHWFTTSFGTPCIPVQIDDSLQKEFITDIAEYKDTPNFIIKDKYIIVEKYLPQCNDLLWYIKKADK